MEQSEKIWDCDFFLNRIPASKEYISYYFLGGEKDRIHVISGKTHSAS